MRLAKLATIAIILIIFVAVIALWPSGEITQPRIIQTNAEPQQNKSRTDDPTYGEEILKVTKRYEGQEKALKEMEEKMAQMRAEMAQMGTDGSAALSKKVRELEGKLQSQGKDFKNNLQQQEIQLRNSLKSITSGDVQQKIDEALSKFKPDLESIAELKKALKGISDGDVQKKIDEALEKFKPDFESAKNALSEANQTIQKQVTSIDELVANRDKPVTPPTPPSPPTKTLDEVIRETKQNQNQDKNNGKNVSPSTINPSGDVSIKPYGTQADPANPTGTGGIGSLTNMLKPGLPNIAETRLIPNDGPFQANIGNNQKPQPIPVYTIPDTSTFVVNTMMTPLIGRVPGTKGDVADPFRFKFITGAENLATNGHRIPGIDNIVWTGFVIGVRDQSCVRAYVDTVTYTFQDGRIKTVTSGKAKGTGGTATLGYLTDPWGKPCIQGQYYSNASQYLTGRGLAAFTSAIAEGIAQADITSTVSDSGVTTQNVTGNTSRYIAATGLAGTAKELADYVKERQAGAFDVIYVPSGMQVQLFVEQQIEIDYDPAGRKISYDYSDVDSPPKAKLD